MKKIVLCGGHLSPALALIRQLQKEKDLEIIFFGRKFATEGSFNTSAEFKEVRNLNIKFINITAGRLSRRLTLNALKSYIKIPFGFIQSLYYLLIFRPKLIVSFGGYLSLPVVFCGWLLGIDSICHEQPAIPGLANKINSLFAAKIFVSWPESVKYFPENKTKVTGNLTREEIFSSQSQNRQIDSFVKNNPGYILVTGGNQGSHFINNLIFKKAQKINHPIFHILGTANYKNDHQKSNDIKNKKYFSCDFVKTADIGAVFKSARFIIGRSGANTVWEAAVLGIPAFFIPLPHAASGEQFENAKILQKAGSAIILNQTELSAKIFLKALESFDQNLKSYQNKADEFKKSLPKNASLTLKSEILTFLK